MITILPYRPEWPGEFLSIGRSLRAAVGDLALRIDHIGSTSVVGLPAKDVIDIQITSAALDHRVKQALETIGYRQIVEHTKDHVPPRMHDADADWAKWVFVEPDGRRRTNVHVRVAGRPNQRYALLFRDYLRAHPDAADTYGCVKVALAQPDPENKEFYYAVKDPVCDLIIQAAEAWAGSYAWEQGPSDC
jgi:GrpB-like predicted nucleotidyltransferase (UPF0157 family)